MDRKRLINACKEHRYLPVFSKRTALRKEIYDKVASRMEKTGPPRTDTNCTRVRRR